MPSENTEQRKLAAIMFTDMVGYSALSQRDDKLALELLEEHRQLLREIFPRFHGTEIKTIGDAFLVEFNSALEAAQCAIEIQRALAKHNADVPPDRRIEVKIGIHIGDVVHRGGDVYGDGVNIASRIERLAGPGGICVSMDVERQIRNALEARFEKLAATELKNISVAMDLFRIVLPWERQTASAAKSEIRIAKSETGARSRWVFATFIAFALIAATLLGYKFWRTRNLVAPRQNTSPARTEAATIPEKSIAVLPFENLSRDPDNAYFAEGMQDEILTRLAVVRDLKVISRTSTAKYQSKPDNLKTVAQELGVATVLEGAVQKAGDKVRVNVQLIDAHNDTHLWAKSYDRDFKDVLGVESEVSQEIADALKANLSPGESHALASARTHDTEAYDLFLRGEYEFRQAQRNPIAVDAYDRAEGFYRQALARDPDFVEAAAGLARSRLSRHWFISPLTAAELEEVKALIDRALALAPNSAEAHLALGLFFYWGHRQYDNALREFNRALELQPNNALARQYSAFVYRRRGEWERSLADSQRAQELDPRDASIPAYIGATYTALRQWKDAERAELRALAIDPHSTLAAVFLINTRLNATGDVGSARRAVDGFPEDVRRALIGPYPSGYGATAELGEILSMPAYLDVMERRFTDAFQALEKQVVKTDLDHLRQLVGRVVLHVLAGETEAAKSAAEEALPLLEARLRERPDDTFAMGELSWVYLALERNADALRLAKQAADSMPIEKDAMYGPDFQLGLARIEARAGAPEEAVKRLRHLLSIPAGGDVSIALLKIDPAWDPIRNRPDFQQLLSGTEQIGPNK